MNLDKYVDCNVKVLVRTVYENKTKEETLIGKLRLAELPMKGCYGQQIFKCPVYEVQGRVFTDDMIRSLEVLDDNISKNIPKFAQRLDNKKADSVNHPNHYNTGKIEVIDYIEDQQLNFNLGNVVKYISRAGKKDSAKELEDLNKAAWYLAREIERLQKEETERRQNESEENN